MSTLSGQPGTQCQGPCARRCSAQAQRTELVNPTMHPGSNYHLGARDAFPRHSTAAGSALPGQPERPQPARDVNHVSPCQ